MVPAIVITAALSYLLGNLNGAVVVSHLIAHEDVRTKGSGNAGLTNFTRNYGSHTSIFVIAIDMGKAILSCLLGGKVHIDGASYPVDPLNYFLVSDSVSDTKGCQAIQL